jgi:hypothetical protein
MMVSCSIGDIFNKDQDKYDPPVLGSTLTPTLVDITESDYDGWFVVGLVFDTGCDEEYNGDFNSYSRINRIPVNIFKKYVYVNYDKTSTTGEKHFVVEGSGNIDVQGDLTLNYTMTFTRKLSCNGIPCEGIESGFGNYTGHWDPDLGIWEGIATGTVNVEFPNTLGNSGDNSITCSASIIKSKITRGFNDPDL